MLRKHAAIEVGSDDPFRYDRLNRRPPIDRLTRLVETISQPFVLSIDAPWGAGKTTFVHMWMETLKKAGHVCLFFNAWENDFAKDPLVSFLGQIQADLDAGRLQLAAHPNLTAGLQRITKAGKKILEATARIGVKIGTMNVLNAEDVKDIVGDVAGKSDLGAFAGDLLKGFIQQQRNIKSFRETLEEFARLAGEQEHKTPVVCIIDELDRCRPLYAIELLENVKHLFNVPGVTFVLALDRRQLCYSVRAVYGAGMDADGYLRRFIDLNYSLPPASPEVFYEYLFDHFELAQIPGVKPTRHMVIDTLAACAEALSFNLRDMEQVFTLINLSYRLGLVLPATTEAILAFMASLKIGDQDLYHRVCEGKASVEDTLGFLKASRRGRALLDDGWTGPVIEGAALRECIQNEETKVRIKELETLNSGSAETNEKQNAAMVLKQYKSSMKLFGTASQLLDSLGNFSP